MRVGWMLAGGAMQSSMGPWLRGGARLRTRRGLAELDFAASHRDLTQTQAVSPAAQVSKVFEWRRRVPDVGTLPSLAVGLGIQRRQPQLGQYIGTDHGLVFRGIELRFDAHAEMAPRRGWLTRGFGDV